MFFILLPFSSLSDWVSLSGLSMSMTVEEKNKQREQKRARSGCKCCVYCDVEMWYDFNATQSLTTATVYLFLSIWTCLYSKNICKLFFHCLFPYNWWLSRKYDDVFFHIDSTQEVADAFCWLNMLSSLCNRTHEPSHSACTPPRLWASSLITWNSIYIKKRKAQVKH